MADNKISTKNVLRQILASFVAHSISIHPGINMAYSNVLLPRIMNSELNSSAPVDLNSTRGNVYPQRLLIDEDEASWIASLVTLATPIGSLLAGPLMDRFGRQKVCAFTVLPIIISWILIVITVDNVYPLYVARILAGVGGGLTTVSLVYVSEICHPTIRPVLLSLTSVFVSFGILLTMFLSCFLDWKAVGICCGGLAFASFAFILFLPESPSWIVGVRGEEEENFLKGLKKAERCLKWLYKDTKDYLAEREALLRIREQKINALKDEALFEREDRSKKFKVIIKSSEAWKPLSILLALFAFQQFSGAYIVIFYAIQIFEKVGSVELNQFTSLVILGLVRFVMAILSMFLSKRAGRKLLLETSGIGMAVTVLIAACYVRFVGQGSVPVLCLLLYVFFASYGMTVVPWTLIGELLPLSIRGKGSGFIVAAAYVFMFVTVKLFIGVLDLIGVVSMLIGFSAFSFVFVVFVRFAVPETLGRTFEEIERMFK